MDWTNKNVAPNKIVQMGDEVEVVVLDIDGERRRISLGMKQCKPNPWDEFAATHNKGDKISGTIKSITDFGIFIGLDGGIDGLVQCPISLGICPTKKRSALTRRATNWTP
jgi:small subunit ribosomal protein S1